MADPKTELERLAEAGRRAEEQRQAERDRQEAARSAEAARIGAKLERYMALRDRQRAELGPQAWVLSSPNALGALQEWPRGVVRAAYAGFTVLAAAIFAAQWLLPFNTGPFEFWMIAALLIPFVGGDEALKRLALRWGPAWHLRRLAALPCPFDVDAYLRELDHRRVSQRIRVRVELEDAAPEAVRESVRLAVVGELEQAEVEWADRGATLLVSSPWLTTGEMGEDNLYSNATLHLFFDRFAQRCLPAIHAALRAVRLSVSVADADRRT